MVDIDHFNSVNETAGLAAGDQVLQDIARTVTQNLQGPGLVGRFGGEQFAILPRQCTKARSSTAPERSRSVPASLACPELIGAAEEPQPLLLA